MSINGSHSIGRRCAWYESTLSSESDSVYTTMSPPAIRNIWRRWNGIESMNYPHNALMTVLSEEGIVGLIFYVAAQAFLVRAMWRIRKAYPAGWLAFLYCLLIYLLTGLDYATVYFSDINLLYLFVLGVIYQLQIRMAPEDEMAALTA